MYRYYFIFRSVTSAQRAIQLLRGKGIEAMLSPAPGVYYANGCSHAVQIKGTRGAYAAMELLIANIVPMRVLRSKDGSFFEEIVI